MLLQAGILILYLLTTQVTDALDSSASSEETNTTALMKAVTLLTNNVKTTEKKVDLLLKKQSEEQCNSLLHKTTCLKGLPHINGTKRFTLWGKTTALCDTTTDEGGWVIIQRRVNNDTDFYKNWNNYKNFFGDLNTNFWLGNDAINRLTSEGYNELRVEIVYNGRAYYAHYTNFYVAGEAMKYRLSVSGYSGTAGDSFTVHNDMYFSTFDNDNDKYAGNLATLYHGAWWYYNTYSSNLNGLWGAESDLGIVWYTTTDWKHSVSFSEMKLRRG